MTTNNKLNSNANIVNNSQTNKEMEMNTLQFVTREHIDVEGAFVVVKNGKARLVQVLTTRVQAAVAFDLSAYDGAADGWYAIDNVDLSDVAWETSAAISKLVLRQAVILVYNDMVTVSRLEKHSDRIVWNSAVDMYDEPVRHVPAGGYGVFPCPRELAAVAEWPTRELRIMSYDYGESGQVVRSINDVYRARAEQGAARPHLLEWYNVDHHNRTVRMYYDLHRREIVVGDVWKRVPRAEQPEVPAAIEGESEMNPPTTTQTEENGNAFEPITRASIDWGRPFLFVEGEQRMVVRRVPGKRTLEVAEVVLPVMASVLADGWYRCPEELVANATWKRSRKATAAVLNKPVIVIERGECHIARMERIDEGIGWNCQGDWWLDALASLHKPENLRYGIIPCPAELADLAVWPKRALYNVSQAYGERVTATVRDVQEVARLQGARVPKLKQKHTTDSLGRDIRVYIDVLTSEEVLRDIWM